MKPATKSPITNLSLGALMTLLVTFAAGQASPNLRAELRAPQARGDTFNQSQLPAGLYASAYGAASSPLAGPRVPDLRVRRAGIVIGDARSCSAEAAARQMRFVGGDGTAHRR